jgi:hypothetical protein
LAPLTPPSTKAILTKRAVLQTCINCQDLIR